MDNRKKFSKKDYEFGRAAEHAVADWLRRIGYRVRTTHDRFAPDVIIQEHASPEYAVEIERRRQRSWDTGPFPYPTVNVPERRWTKGGHFMVVSYQLTNAILVYKSDIDAAIEAGATRLVNNVNVDRERIAYVQRKCCRQFDLTDFSKRSIDRDFQSELF